MTTKATCILDDIHGNNNKHNKSHRRHRNRIRALDLELLAVQVG